MNKRLLFLMLTLLFVMSLTAQQKEERETRIAESEVPEKMLDLLALKQLDITSLKYYHEIDGTHRSYEAKFKYQGNRFSAEFNEAGDLEDIEVRIKKKDIPDKTLTNIEQGLDQTYPKWRIEKVQLQYVNQGDPKAALEAALSLHTNWDTNFEIILLTKEKGKLSRFEYLFSKKGKSILVRPVIRRSHDFLLF